jgi:PAS domain-containing protein
MPQFSGPRALELLNERSLDIPFIIISGTVGEDAAVAAIKQGASDYLIKDRLTRLGPAVAHALAQHKFRNDRRRAEEELADSERRYRQLIDGLPVAVYTTDAEGYVTLFNENAVALWGRAPVLGVDRWGGANKLFTADGKPLAMEEGPLGTALRENRALAGCEISTERPDGTRASYLAYPTPLRSLR